MEHGACDVTWCVCGGGSNQTHAQQALLAKPVDAAEGAKPLKLGHLGSVDAVELGHRTVVCATTWRSAAASAAASAATS